MADPHAEGPPEVSESEQALPSLYQCVNQSSSEAVGFHPSVSSTTTSHRAPPPGRHEIGTAADAEAAGAHAAPAQAQNENDRTLTGTPHRVGVLHVQ